MRPCRSETTSGVTLLSEGGFDGPLVVRRQETSAAREMQGSALVSDCRCDLTRI
jgi:hypothetical protein